MLNVLSDMVGRTWRWGRCTGLGGGEGVRDCGGNLMAVLGSGAHHRLGLTAEVVACCLASETYGKNGGGDSNFQRIASSTTGDWSPFFMYISIFFRKYTLRVCYIFNAI